MSEERPVTVRYQLNLPMQWRLLRIAHLKPQRRTVDLHPFFADCGVVFQPGTYALLDLPSHILTVRNDSSNRLLAILILEDGLHAKPRRLTLTPARIF